MIKIKSLLLTFFVLNLSIVYAINDKKNSPEWEKVYDQISNEQKSKLEKCFKYLLKNNLLGYVLYGSKPIFLGGFFDSVDSYHIISKSNTQEQFLTKELIKILEKLDLMGKGSNYFIQVQYKKFHTKKDSYSYVLFINKKAFIETVNKNLSLFQYVLGPNVTAKKLLEKVMDPNETIFTALNNDVTLVGILLGYGAYNSCFYSYAIRINKYLEYNHENIPLVSRKQIYTKKLKNNNLIFSKYNEKYLTKNIFPSFGYTRLKDEHKDLEKRTIGSFQLIERTDPLIPQFSCENKFDTQELIKNYRNENKKIQNILSSENQLKKILNRFAGKDQLGVKEFAQKKNQSYKNNDKKDYSDLLSQMFLQSFEKYFDNDQTFILAFIDGLKMKESEECIMCNHIMNQKKISKRIKAKENLIFSNQFFKKLKKEDDLQENVVNMLSYKILQTGHGKTLDNTNNVVSLFYKLSRIDGKSFDIENAMGVKIKEPLTNFIPGIAKALIGMQKNEKRKIFIHPSYGYGEKTTLDPNIGLIAEIELIDFEKTEKRNNKDIRSYVLKAEKYDLSDLQEAKRQNTIYIGNFLGIQNGEYIRKKKDNFSLERIINNLKTPKKSKIDLENDKMQKVINDVFWLIYE